MEVLSLSLLRALNGAAFPDVQRLWCEDCDVMCCYSPADGCKDKRDTFMEVLSLSIVRALKWAAFPLA